MSVELFVCFVFFHYTVPYGPVDLPVHWYQVQVQSYRIELFLDLICGFLNGRQDLTR